MLFFWRTLVVIVNKHYVHSYNLGNKEACCLLILSLVRQNVWGVLCFTFYILEQSVVRKIQYTEVTRWKVNREPFSHSLFISSFVCNKYLECGTFHFNTVWRFALSSPPVLTGSGKGFLLFTRSQRKTTINV